MLYHRRIVIAAAAALLSSSAARAQRVLHVPGEYPTIQAGIDAAANNDTVLVAAGTYSGPGNVDLDYGGKIITVRGDNGEAQINDSAGGSMAVHFHSGESPNAIFAVRVGWANATSGGNAALLYARSTGSFRIPQNQPCAGTPLGLSWMGLRLAWRGSAGPDGQRTLDAVAPGGACGGFIQVIDGATCRTSAVSEVQ